MRDGITHFTASESLAAIDWQDAKVFDHQREGEILDPDYRNAKVAGTNQAAKLISALDAEAISVAWPYIHSLGACFSSVSLSGSQLVKYEVGGFFRQHRDASQNYFNRCFTIIKYLSSCEGGDTCFPEFELTVPPREGDWIIFYSEYLHRGDPVLSGQKLLYVTWVVG